MDKLTIQGTQIMATSPEGQTIAMSLPGFLEKVSSQMEGSRSCIFPDGLKAIERRGNMELWIHQIPPRIYCFKWIANDSPVKYGSGTTYRTVRISLPYLITFVVFQRGPDGKMTLLKKDEGFFGKEPAEWNSNLYFPALLNLSKYRPQEGNPLAWICTQYIDKSYEKEPDERKRMRRAFIALQNCLLESGFNYSSEINEGNSWFSESRKVDPRVATVEAWEKATADDPMFVLEVPWLSTGLNTAEVADRIFGLYLADRVNFDTARDVARVVCNHGKSVVN